MCLNVETSLEAFVFIPADLKNPHLRNLPHEAPPALVELPFRMIRGAATRVPAPSRAVDKRPREMSKSPRKVEKKTDGVLAHASSRGGYGGLPALTI